MLKEGDCNLMKIYGDDEVEILREARNTKKTKTIC